MQAVRHLLTKRRLAWLICAAALMLKMLVPAGYMIGNSHGTITVTICSGTAPRTMTIEVPGMHGDMPGHGKSDGGKAEMPCVFSSLSAAALGAIDPIQLAGLIAFVLALGLIATVPPVPSRPARLRPPLRGPPAYL